MTLYLLMNLGFAGGTAVGASTRKPTLTLMGAG
jgi:hypothetical protein